MGKTWEEDLEEKVARGELIKTPVEGGGFSYENPNAPTTRNPDLAGQTVSSGGFNNTYDENGYLISQTNLNNRTNQANGIKAAPSIDTILGDKNYRTSLGGSPYDQQNLSTAELEYGANLRKMAESGQISWNEANKLLELRRALYGYSGGPDGSQHNGVSADGGLSPAVDVKNGRTDLNGVMQQLTQAYVPGNTQTSTDILRQMVNGYAPSGYTQYTQPSVDTTWRDIADKLANAYIGMNYEDWTKGDQYKALADRYGTQGKMSMQDVLGQIASRTGGLASSYATTAAQQQYNQWMAALEDAARQGYNDDRQQMYNNANMALDYYGRDYNEYLDQLGQMNKDRDYNLDLLSKALAQSNYEREWENTLERQRLADEQNAYGTARSQVDNMIKAGQMPPDDLIEASGYSRDYIESMVGYYAAQAAAKASGSGRGSDGGTSSNTTPNKSIYDQLYEAGMRTETDAYDMLRNMGYTKTDANRYAKEYMNNKYPTIRSNDIKNIDSGARENSAYRNNPPAESVSNKNGDGWVYVPGLGRFTYQELLEKVNSGEVIESYDKATNTYTYKKRG